MNIIEFMVIISVITLLFCVSLVKVVYAGVDFSMTGREYVYDIPRFTSKEDALDWANKQKWVEPQRRQLESYVAKIGYLYDVEEDFRQKAFFYHQWERGTLALRIIENYRRLGIKGNDVGAYVVASSIPII